jgi:LuxR family maltose regulon positive regulatory protein
LSPPSQVSPSTRSRIEVTPRERVAPLRVVAPPERAGSATLARLGAKTVLAGTGEWPGLPLALVESKLAVPASRPDAVSRPALVNRLRTLADCGVVAIVAPAGYGKTTVCSQWAARDGRACAWLTVDERDNDPVVFLRHVAAAIGRAAALDAGVLDDLARPGESMWASSLPRLATAIAAIPTPLLLILDDAHVIRTADAVAALEVVAGAFPPGSTVAVTGRRAPRLPLARLRVAGRLGELDAADLRLTSRETALAARALGVQLSAEELAELTRRSQGWPAGVHLLAVAGRPGGVPSGGNAQLADYFRSEVLAGLTEGERTFARRTAILDRLSAPLCRAVLGGGAQAGRRLEALVAEGAFVIPVDAEQRWYRYHTLFGEFLRRELETHEPELAPQLYERAADWYEAHGESAAAVGAAQAAGDDERTARLVGSVAVAAICAGDLAAVAGWFDRLAEGDSLERHPAIAAVGAWVAAIRGRTSDAERLLACAERRKKDTLADGTRLGALVSLVHAALCTGGVERMAGDAAVAAAALPADSRLRASAIGLHGMALMLAGDHVGADESLTEACDAAERLGAPVAHSLALAERSLLAGEAGDHARAEALARTASAIVEAAGLETYPTRGAVLAASARAALRHGRWDDARADLEAAADIVPQLTGTLPWLAVQVRLELCRVYLALRDAAGARRLLGKAQELLERWPGLGTLVAQADQLADELAELDRTANGSVSSLTAAELRLLPLLSTHLSFREIGERLFVSRNTIKTQAISVYRKLGVSTRSDAIARAQQLGLVEAGAASEITPSG